MSSCPRRSTAGCEFTRPHELTQKEGTGEERRNALLGKGLGRRTVQLHGLAPSGDAAFDAVDEVGREAFEERDPNNCDNKFG